MKKEELVEKIIKSLPENPTKEDIKKAVTSEANLERVEVSEDVKHGENKPTIEDAKTVAQLQQQPAQAPQIQQVQTPFQLGATLQQGPTGNIFTNFKQSPVDYVEAAKPKGVVTMTEEELKKLTEEQGIKKAKSAEAYAKKIQGPKKVNEVMDKVPDGMKKQVLAKLRQKADEAKKSGDMDKCNTYKAMCSRIEKMYHLGEDNV